MGEGEAKPNKEISQSEHDWAYAKQRLTMGADLGEVVQAITEYRPDKWNPEYAMNAAQAGNPRAQLRLAILYEAGDGVPRDVKAAFSWYARAAAAGEPASQAELGGYYEDGDGVAENWDLAARLYRASASQGWHKGQFALGRAYQFGLGVPQDRSQAIAWFERSAAQRNSQGSYYARWLSDRSNNIGFRNDAEHDQVIAGKLRFALGAADPGGITFHTSGQRVAWLGDWGSN